MALLLATRVAIGASSAVVLPDPQLDDPLATVSSKVDIVIAGGCFWGIEELYQHVRGVTDAVSGYAGGSARDANYDRVSTGTTGHAESVRVTYDPAKITYGQLLKMFFSVAHDATQRGRQGPDVGPQYRSAIFVVDDRQRQIARAYVEQLTGAHVFGKAIATEIVPLGTFYVAEPVHQDYASRNLDQEYIRVNDLPKLDNLRRLFRGLYR